MTDRRRSGTSPEWNRLNHRLVELQTIDLLYQLNDDLEAEILRARSAAARGHHTKARTRAFEAVVVRIEAYLLGLREFYLEAAHEQSETLGADFDADLKDALSVSLRTSKPVNWTDSNAWDFGKVAT